jgi:hypothetical protein
MDNLSVFFLAEREQSADDVMARLAAFILDQAFPRSMRRADRIVSPGNQSTSHQWTTFLYSFSLNANNLLTT